MAITVDDCRLVELPKVKDNRGNLTFIEGKRHIPFEIKRVYYLYDVPGGAFRGGHGHRELQEFIIAMSGSFTVVIDDGRSKRKFPLNRSYFGLYVPTTLCREPQNFPSVPLCTVLAQPPPTLPHPFPTSPDFPKLLNH